MSSSISDEDIQDLVVHLGSKRSRRGRTIPLPELINIIASRIERRREEAVQSPTPRMDDIQVLPIITSRQITLSFRPNAKGSVALEIDTGGVPVYIGFSKHNLKVHIAATYMGKKRDVNIISSPKEILLPFTDLKTTVIEMEAVYDGKNISISALIR